MDSVEMDPTGETLSVTVGQDADGTPVVALAGELDINVVASAEDAFAELPPSGPDHSAVVVDMTDLAFMDSAGLTVLLLACRRGYALRLRRPNTIIRHLIAATGLGELLPIEQDGGLAS